MKIQAICFALAAVALLAPGECSAQDIPAKPQVGMSMPDMTFRNVFNYKRNSVSMSDMRGKWVFLNFWYPGCTSSVKSLEKLSAYQDQFGDNIQFLMICLNSSMYSYSEDSFKGLTRHYGLHLPAIFDSTLQQAWQIWAMPYIIVIDPAGKVFATTNGGDLSAEKLTALINGVRVSFHSGEVSEKRFDIRSFPGSRDSSLVYRSILTAWRGERGGATALEEYVALPEAYRSAGIVMTGLPLGPLYTMAYYGLNEFRIVAVDGKLVMPTPKLRIKDKSNFVYDTTYSIQKNIYNYNLALPAEKSKDLCFIKRVFQKDLHAAFGYSVTSEIDTVEAWQLTWEGDALSSLRTKGGEARLEGTPISLKIVNRPVQDLVDVLSYKLGNWERVFVAANTTGYEGNIDIELKAVLTDMEDVQRALRKYGLDIKPLPTVVETLVIEN